MERNDVLIVVDVQNDFITGSLAVTDAQSIIPIVNNLMNKFRHVVATKDWHPSNHSSFKENGGLWPVHCVAGTTGAEFPQDLNIAHIKAVTHKGFDAELESYSGVKDNALNVNPLALYLSGKMHLEDVYNKDVRVFVCGLATDYCVKSTLLDLVEIGLETYLVIDACKSVDLKYFELLNGVKYINSDQLDTLFPGDSEKPRN